MVGISQPAVSDLVARKIINLKQDAGKCLQKYCNHIREQSAGRTGDLAGERTRLSAAQADAQELKNHITRNEYAPIHVIEQSLSSVGRQIAGILEALPVKLKREAKLKMKQVKIVEREIAVARNVAAKVRPDWKEINMEE